MEALGLRHRTVIQHSGRSQGDTVTIGSHDPE